MDRHRGTEREGARNRESSEEQHGLREKERERKREDKAEL